MSVRLPRSSISSYLSGRFTSWPPPCGSRSRGAGGSCRRPPLRPVSPRHLYGRGDLRLFGQVVGVAEREEDVLELPCLAEVHLGQPRVEVPEGGEELGGVHEHTAQSQPSLWPFARTSMRAPRSPKPWRSSSSMRRSCSRVADTPGGSFEDSGDSSAAS